MQDSTKCKICNGNSTLLFSKTILNKHQGNYYQCNTCNFMQVENPHWLEEAYNNAITDLDIGLIYRNNILKDKTELFLKWFYKTCENALDYGGGYGMFVRMMRDLGFNFYRQDIYCQNLFADHFDIEDINTKTFDFLTAFEVFEHFENPIKEFNLAKVYSDTILFSTELQPDKDIENWWYLTPETGQHLSFYTQKSLRILAKKNNMSYYNINNGLHLISAKKFNEKKIKFHLKDKPLQRLLNKLFLPKTKTLLQKDYNFIKNKITSKS